MFIGCEYGQCEYFPILVGAKINDIRSTKEPILLNLN